MYKPWVMNQLLTPYKQPYVAKWDTDRFINIWLGATRLEQVDETAPHIVLNVDDLSCHEIDGTAIIMNSYSYRCVMSVIEDIRSYHDPQYMFCGRMGMTADDWETCDEVDDIEMRLYLNTPKVDEKLERPRIFVDMDGVVAKWNTEATMEEVFGKGYFRHLPPNQTMINNVESLMDDYEVFILSKSVYGAIEDKYEWLKEHMPFIDSEHIIFVPLACNKEDFIPAFRETDVLLDDYTPNLESFRGVGVNVCNGINHEDGKRLNVSIFDNEKDFRDIIREAVIPAEKEIAERDEVFEER